MPFNINVKNYYLGNIPRKIRIINIENIENITKSNKLHIILE